MKYENNLAELRGDIRMHQFEIEKISLALQDRGSAMKQIQIENDKLREQVEVMKLSREKSQFSLSPPKKLKMEKYPYNKSVSFFFLQ